MRPEDSRTNQAQWWQIAHQWAVRPVIRQRRLADYPKVVGQVNNALRGEVVMTPQLQNALALLRNIELLPDHRVDGMDPTRMMAAYPQIDNDYKVGNTLLMAEVGSVSRHRPAPGYYHKQYRIHIDGGLKEITFINPVQQELVYAPGTPYLVTERRVGKVKKKKGDQSHVHIYLRYAPENRVRGIDLTRVRPG